MGGHSLSMKQDGHVLKSASQIVAEVGYLHSDAAYVFPVTPEKPFGGAVMDYAAQGLLNIKGNECKVFNMHTYPDALDVLKQADKDSVLSVYTLSTGLARMELNLRHAASVGQPMVVHVAAAHIADDFEITNDVNPVYDLIGSGVAIVTSSSAIDCASTAIYAYTLAQRLQRPVVHMVDGLLGLSVRTTTAPSWEAITDKSRQMGRMQLPSRGGGEVGGFVIYDYYGDANPTTLLVATGGAAVAARRAVDADETHDSACLVVRVLEPWYSDDFIMRLPRGQSSKLRKIVVVDHASTAAPLATRVRQSVAQDRSLAHVPVVLLETTTIEDADACRLSLFAAEGGHGMDSTSYSHGTPSRRLKELAVSPSPQRGSRPLPSGASDASTGSSTCLDAETSQFRFWWGVGQEKTQLQGLSAHLMKMLPPSREDANGYVDVASYYDCYRKEGDEAAMTDVLLSCHAAAMHTPSTRRSHNPSERANRLDHMISSANMSVVFRTEFLEECDVFASLADNGLALLNCPSNFIGKHRVLPADAAARGLRVFHVNAVQSARILGTTPGVVLAIAFLYLAAKENGASEHSAHASAKAYATAQGVGLDMVDYMLYSSLMQFPVATAVNKDLTAQPKPAILTPRALYSAGPTAAAKVLTVLREEQVASRCLTTPRGRSKLSHRPDLPDTQEFIVKNNVRLTSTDYYRNTFHIELAPKDPSHKLTYEPGQVLNVYPKNDTAKVAALCKALGHDPTQWVASRTKTRSGAVEEKVNTVQHYLTNVIDVFGQPKPSYYRALAEYTTNAMTATLLGAMADNYDAAVEEAFTFADILENFAGTVSVPAEVLVGGSLIPTMSPRSYSIASCTEIVGNEVHLVVVVETWNDRNGGEHAGLCSHYLSGMHPAQDLALTANVVESTALKITDYTKPCVMIGLGTGIAPFRAFIQRYFYERENNGVDVGEVVLYFGARTSANEYYYGHELEQYKQFGIVQLRLAFSRDDPKKKVYVQNLIMEDTETLKRLILKEKGYIMMCGPDWPVPTIHKTLKGMGVSVDDMIKEGRYLEEVY